MRFNETKLKLIQFLADGEFHSGSELAKSLGVSRSAVWKQIAGFADIGVEIVAVSGKGYRLNQPLELLKQSTIEALPQSLGEDAAEWLGDSSPNRFDQWLSGQFRGPRVLFRHCLLSGNANSRKRAVRSAMDFAIWP